MSNLETNIRVGGNEASLSWPHIEVCSIDRWCPTATTDVRSSSQIIKTTTKQALWELLNVEKENDHYGKDLDSLRHGQFREKSWASLSEEDWEQPQDYGRVGRHDQCDWKSRTIKVTMIDSTNLVSTITMISMETMMTPLSKKIKKTTMTMKDASTMTTATIGSTWNLAKMKKLLQSHFLPSDYQRVLYGQYISTASKGWGVYKITHRNFI